ncbi:kinesin-like protein KIN-14F [Papaver somniferum]|uniref:kinesin-like protein KIN-14F n=1 Tax=Papaver somniferum TaxID=3469 RepID=UPI000E6F935F|nr:kinesin-like protein KIN-14F [Papaver somniferum]
MAKEVIIPFSVASVVEDVLKQNGTRVRNIDMVSRKAEESALRRYEAAAWLRKTVGFVLSKDLPEEPSEEEFRLGLRSGIILCSALNKVDPGSVPRVVEKPAIPVPDGGSALSAYQYFENVRNFLDTVQEIGIPVFEPSDFEQGGKSGRIVNCVLALKSYSDWKQNGGNSLWKFAGTSKSNNTPGKIVRRNSDLFMTSLSRTQSTDEKLLEDAENSNDDLADEPVTEMVTSNSLNALVRAALCDKRPEEVPMLVESMLSKVMEEFERRLKSHNAAMETTLDGSVVPDGDKSLPETTSGELEMKTPPEDAAAVDDNNSVVETIHVENTDIEKDAEENTSEIVDQKIATEAEEGDKESASEITQGEQVCTLEEIAEDEHMKQKLIDEEEVKRRVYEEIKEKVIAEEREKIRKEEELRLKNKTSELLKQQQLLDQQKRNVQELKHALHNTKEGMQHIQIKFREEFNDFGKHLNVLTHAASRYHRVLEENRKLYNQVQDLKGSIRVYCRVRPFLPGQAGRSSIVDHIDEGSIEIITLSKNGKEARKSFIFNKVFGPSATQEEVFLDTQPLIRSVLDGFNVCIFAYGQTGSGKTHTMTGPNELTEETQGVNFRALNDLFYLSEERKETFRYEVSVQMMEIYNEQVRDLLVSDGLNKKLEIRNSSQGLNVPDANLVPVTSTSDVIELMNAGQRNRAVSSTALNDRSSRSHSCLTVHVQGKDLTSGNTLRGCMHLVDLAGSERVNKSEVTGDRLKEALHINKSLSALGDVIASLAQKNAHVPYRNSKLTQLLQDSLGGQAKTLMFVHISPDPDAVLETLSTLKFAERVATVELGAAKSNTESGDVKELKEQISRLKAALARKDGAESGGNLTRSVSSSSISSTPEIPLATKNTGGSLSLHGSKPETPVYTHGSKPEIPLYIHGSRPELSVSEFEYVRSPTSGSLPLYSEIVKGAAAARKQAADEKELASKDWVDKVMVNKLEMANGKESPAQGHWDAVNSKLPELFYQKSNTKNHPEQKCNGVAGTRSEMGTPDDSDIDAVTSDSTSEPDLLYQQHIPRVSSVPTSLGSKLRKPSQIPGRIPDHSPVNKSSSIPSLAASPSRKMSNGVGPPLHKNGRQPVSTAGKKKSSGYGK